MHNSTALLTDRYELTMVDAALRSGTANRASVFEVFTRRLPGARRYGVVAGTGRLLDAIKRFRFEDSELSWLASQNFLQPKTLDWLANYRFSGEISGHPEGELFFPNTPILTVEASFAEGVLLETLALSILNYDCAVATAASRMFTAARGRKLAEMGSRRTGESSAVHAARAAFIAGFDATSNLEAGRTHGIPTMGTAAHAFTLLHDTEADAFAAQVAALGPETTLLVDTYDIIQGVKTAIEVAGTGLGAVRIDSGDLTIVAAEVRRLLDSLGAHNTKITVTNDLDEHTIAALAASPVDSFGVGTSVVTGSGSPTMGMVYKLVARQDGQGIWHDVAKNSSGKSNLGGKKTVQRRFEKGTAAAEVLVTEASKNASTATPAGDHENITVPLAIKGEPLPQYLGETGLLAARARHKESLKKMPRIAMSLRRGDPALPTEVR
ncbi:MAG: nicotinate phosphoribosyltransferase [Microbacteriaceae bacterium]|nr:nicotinate phosphoribosyltransferase [Microbacteriaceae bacterium]